MNARLNESEGATGASVCFLCWPNIWKKERGQSKELEAVRRVTRTYKAADAYDQCWNAGREAARGEGGRERARDELARRIAGFSKEWNERKVSLVKNVSQLRAGEEEERCLHTEIPDAVVLMMV